jgi:hypothetical protein
VAQKQSKLFKVGKNYVKPKDEWVVVKDIFEPIVGACAGSQREAQADVQGKKGAEYLFRHCLLPGLRQAHFILS